MARCSRRFGFTLLGLLHFDTTDKRKADNGIDTTQLVGLLFRHLGMADGWIPWVRVYSVDEQILHGSSYTPDCLYMAHRVTSKSFIYNLYLSLSDSGLGSLAKSSRIELNQIIKKKKKKE
jgi:hypothetical protein